MKEVLSPILGLKHYCESEGYKGWDPYDGLNSKVAKAILPLKHSAFLRLCVIQGFKRCPVNFRRIAMVPKEYNAKGIGLFLQGYCNLYNAVAQKTELSEYLGSKEDILERIKYLADLLIKMSSDKIFSGEYHGACWGYNFDWQARKLFLFPKYTPTVVATNFCATALMAAYEITGEREYIETALSSANFILEDLHRYYPKPGNDDLFLFSYSKLSGNDTVYNASLLGSRLLAYCYKYTGNAVYKEAARASVSACVNDQNADGSWVYGLLPVQNWVDSFHTGYNLDGLAAFEELTRDMEFHTAIEKGFNYYVKNFFEDNGRPKYYNDRMYPIDIHCPGQLFVTLSRLHKFGQYHGLARKVLDWTVKNMQDKRGYFYYQMKPGISSIISYMRWSNAFMFSALSYYLLEEIRHGETLDINGTII